MLVQNDTDCPSLDTLTGTGNEPALHFHCSNVRVKSTPETSLSDCTAHLFVTSESMLVYNPDKRILVTILYPEIVLHAVVSDPQALYLQIECDDLANLVLDNSLEMLELSLSSTVGSESADAMFAALSKCASMHPDVDTPSGEDGRFDDGLSDPNHQWITSDSIGQFEDATEFPVEEAGSDTPEVNGDGEARKWRRTS